MRRSMAAVLCGLSVLPAAAIAQQQQSTIPDTIVTGTRIPTPAERVPATITVITRREIQERGYQTLAEALAPVPGLRIARLGGLGQPASAFVRGTNARHVLVLLDGVPLNDVSDPNGAFNFGGELLFDLERIEVLRGPASALYGSAAIGGVINLVTRRAPRDRAFVPYGEFAGGTQDTMRAGLGAVGTVGAYDYLLSGQSLSTKSFNAIAPRLTDINERDGFRGAFTTARLGWTPVEGTRFEGLLRWQQNNIGLDDIPRDDPNYSGENRRWFGQLRGESRLFDGAWTTGLRLATTEDRRRFVNLPDLLSTSTADDLYHGSRTTLDWGNSVVLPALGPLADGALGFGVTHFAEEAESASGSPVFRTTVDAVQHATAGYATLQYRLLNRLDMTAGLRHDATTGFTEATTWRLGAVLALPEIASRLRASGGTAFAAPSLFQRFGIIGSFFRGNPDLQPERAIGWEVGGETDLPAFGRPAFATTYALYFQNRVRDLITFNPAFDTLVNVDRARIQGAELGLTLRPSAWFETTAAWTVLGAFDATTGRRLPRRPEHTLSVTARVSPTPRVVVAPTLLFVGRSQEAAFASYNDQGVPYPYPRSNPAGALLDLTVTWRAFDRASLFLEARNLTNSRFEPANGFVTPGRSVLIGTRFAL